MKGLMKYLIMMIFTVCYLQTALEVNVGPITNSYGDEYDTYVQPEQQISNHGQKIDFTTDLAILPEFITFKSSDGIQVSSNDKIFSNLFIFQKYRLYINFCSLRI